MASLENITLLLLDVDGVLTDGGIIYNDNNIETKVFNSKDGMGMRLLMDAGIDVGIVTGRASDVLRHRCKNLGIQNIFDGIQNKGAALSPIMARTGKPADEMAFMGDDLPDIPLMKQVGVAMAVADAHDLVQRHADLVTTARGGQGAVREVCEAILKAKGLWEDSIRPFLA